MKFSKAKQNSKPQNLTLEERMGETFMATYGLIWKSTSHTKLPTSTLWNTGSKLIQKKGDLVSHQYHLRKHEKYLQDLLPYYLIWTYL